MSLPAESKCLTLWTPEIMASVGHDSLWAVKLCSPIVRQRQAITTQLLSFRADRALLLLIKKINKESGHTRFTSIIAYVVLITVIKCYLSWISGWRCRDLHLKAHCVFCMWCLLSFPPFTSKETKLDSCGRLAVPLLPAHQEKLIALFSKHPKRSCMSFIFHSEYAITDFF